jgi:hypothetical protein
MEEKTSDRIAEFLCYHSIAEELNKDSEQTPIIIAAPRLHGRIKTLTSLSHLKNTHGTS